MQFSHIVLGWKDEWWGGVVGQGWGVEVGWGEGVGWLGEGWWVRVGG